MRRTVLLLALLSALGVAHAEDPPRVSGEAAPMVAVDAGVLALAELPLAKSAVPLQRWSPLDPAAVDALLAHNATSGKRLQVGIERGPAERDAKLADWAWSRLADGRRVARLRVQSPEAAALRLAFDLRGLPAGAELRFAGDGETQSVVEPVRGSEVAAQRAVQALYWGPVTEGDP